MKRFISAFAVLALIATLLYGCTNVQENTDDKLSIVTTVFPVYDWTVNILGAADAEVTMLLDSGVDLHSYQPTADDMIKISTCDIFIYVGGESDEWAEDAIRSAANKDMTAIKLMDVLGDALKEEELVEGMQGEEEEDAEYDEHIWLSLGNAVTCCKAIAAGLSAADPDNSKLYADDLASYTDKLTDLDAEYRSAVDAAGTKTVLFGDRFPFRYLTDDYGLTYYAAFSGCSAESEASFETVAFLSNKITELGLKTVLTIEGGDNKIAETLIKTSGTDAEIISLDSMQSVTAEDVRDGASYLAVMEKNLDVLKSALG